MAFLKYNMADLPDEPQLISPGECNLVIKSHKETKSPLNGKHYDELIVYTKATDINGRSSPMIFRFGDPEYIWSLGKFCLGIGLYNALKEGWIDYKYLDGLRAKFT